MKKTIRIFCLPSHQTRDRTSGVDFVRIIQPLSLLNGYEDDDVKIETEIFDIHQKKQPNWQDVARDFDIIYLNYIALPWAFAAMGAMARHYKRTIVLDTDDDIHAVQMDNPTYIGYHKDNDLALKDLTAIYNEVDYITVTNSYLKNVLLTRTTKTAEKIKVFPNYIDLDTLYTHRPAFKDTNDIELYHYGSTTHFIDLDNEEFAKGVDQIFQEYPNVTFKTVGALIPKFKERWGMRYTNAYGDTDIYKWIKNKFGPLMDEADIMVVPLDNNQYTRSKSNIKFLESSSAGKPGCWADIRQYREVVAPRRTGFLCQTQAEWYRAIKYLIDHPKKRKEMGEAAFEFVKRNHQAKDHVKDYAEFFRNILLTK